MTEQPSRPSAPPDPVQALWTITDLARFLCKSERWISYRLARTAETIGSLPHIRLGRSPRFIPSQIEAWLAAGCPPAAHVPKLNVSKAPQPSSRGGIHAQ